MYAYIEYASANRVCCLSLLEQNAPLNGTGPPRGSDAAQQGAARATRSARSAPQPAHAPRRKWSCSVCYRLHTCQICHFTKISLYRNTITLYHIIPISFLLVLIKTIYCFGIFILKIRILKIKKVYCLQLQWLKRLQLIVLKTSEIMYLLFNCRLPLNTSQICH